MGIESNRRVVLLLVLLTACLIVVSCGRDDKSQVEATANKVIDGILYTDTEAVLQLVHPEAKDKVRENVLQMADVTKDGYDEAKASYGTSRAETMLDDLFEKADIDLGESTESLLMNWARGDYQGSREELGEDLMVSSLKSLISPSAYSHKALRIDRIDGPSNEGIFKVYVTSVRIPLLFGRDSIEVREVWDFAKHKGSWYWKTE